MDDASHPSASRRRVQKAPKSHSGYADQQSRQKRTVSKGNLSAIVPPTDTLSDAPQRIEEPTYKYAEKARRQPDEDVLSYGETPRQQADPKKV